MEEVHLKAVLDKNKEDCIKEWWIYGLFNHGENKII